MQNENVPDSTDWLSTPLSGLAAVENALRCQVCKDFYSTPMITSCSHTFCSLCIRRVLAIDSKCPLCRASEQEMKLRSNWSMEEAVEAFVKARPAALELARNGNAPRRASPKRKAADAPGDGPGAAQEPKRLRSSTRLSRSRAQQATAQTEPQYVEEDDNFDIQEIPDSGDEDNDAYVPEPGETSIIQMHTTSNANRPLADGLVACPSCQRRMKDWQVFKHLEACPGPIKAEPKQGEASTGSASEGIISQAQRQDKKLDRLPALNYSMLKEAVLRKKLWEIGLDNTGSRSALERRHKEWVTLWNANCDAARPKSRAKLMNDLHLWERTQGSAGGVASGLVQNQPAIKNKDFDGAAWGTKHDSSFKDLIASAMKSRQDAQKKAAEGEKQSTTTSTANATSAVEPDSCSSLPPKPDQEVPGVTGMPPVGLEGEANGIPASAPPAVPTSESWTATATETRNDSSSGTTQPNPALGWERAHDGTSLPPLVPAEFYLAEQNPPTT